MDISQFNSTRILVVGDLMLDRYWWGSVDRISPEAPVPIVRLQRESLALGGAANVAANAVALGAKVDLIGIVGQEPEGDSFVRLLIEIGASSSSLIRSDSRRTIVKTRVVAHGQQVLRLDAEDILDLDESEVATILSGVKSSLTESDAVILSDYGKGVVSEVVAAEVISLARSAGIPVLTDPKGKHFDKYAGTTVLTPNRREAAEACKLEENDQNLVAHAGERLLKQYSVENVIITESENGMTLFQNNSSPVHFPAVAHEVYDVTGAGDTVIATLGVATAAQFDLVSATALSNLAAGISVSHMGTTAVSFAELQTSIERGTLPSSAALR